MQIEHTIERDDEEIDVTIEFDYQPYCRGSRDEMGVPLEPDDEEEINITNVFDANENEYKLTEREETEVLNKCMDHIHED